MLEIFRRGHQALDPKRALFARLRVRYGEAHRAALERASRPLFSVRPPVRVDVDAPAIAPKRGQVIVRVGDIVAGAAIPDFEIDDIAFATVDEAVPIRFPLGKPGGHPWPQHRLSGV